MIHKFKADLAFSNDEQFQHAIDSFYRRYFACPYLVVRSHDPTKGDYERSLQRAGVDKTIPLPSGNLLYIEEKRRKTSYLDVCLEWESVYASGYRAPGYVDKLSSSDYLAYVIESHNLVYMFPSLLLERAVRNHGDEWRAKYGVRSSDNDGYKTFWTAVPYDDVASAVTEELRQPFALAPMGE